MCFHRTEIGTKVVGVLALALSVGASACGGGSDAEPGTAGTSAGGKPSSAGSSSGSGGKANAGAGGMAGEPGEPEPEGGAAGEPSEPDPEPDVTPPLLVSVSP